MNSIRIGNTQISKTGKPVFIADIAANHDGELNRAYKLIELAKESGADVAKFQNFRAETIVSKNGFDTMPKSAHQSSWKKSVFEVYQNASVDPEWTAKLKRKCDEVEIEYMTSPYDMQSVDHADPFVNAYKIGSGDITWIEFIEYIAGKKKPILLATGASSLQDVMRACDVLARNKSSLILMQCNTNYTADVSNFKYINLNVLTTFQNLFPECLLGLSDHTHGYTTVLGAFVLGARVFEKHFTDDNDRVGPDHKFAMNPADWKKMVVSTNELFQAMGDGRKRIEENEIDAAVVQRRAMYARRDMAKGHCITREDLIPLRPIRDGGVPPYEIEKLVGKTIKRDVRCDEMLNWEDVC